MTTRVRVAITWDGHLADDRVLAVRERVAIGEHDLARIGFFGGTLWLEPTPEGCRVGGELLRPDESRVFVYASVRVLVECVAADPMAREPLWEGDVRLPVLLAAVALLGMWWSAVVDTVEAHPEVSEGLQAMVAHWVGATPEQPVAVEPEELASPWSSLPPGAVPTASYRPIP